MEARNVYLVSQSAPVNEVSKKSIFEISHLTLRESLDYFNTLQMQGSKGEIAAKVVREIGLRLKFLNDVG